MLMRPRMIAAFIMGLAAVGLRLVDGSEPGYRDPQAGSLSMSSVLAMIF